MKKNNNTPPPIDMTPQEKQIFTLRLHNQQLNRMVWALVNKLGGTVEMMQEGVPPLWDLKVDAGSGPGLIKFTSALMPEVEESVIIKLADSLLGTTIELAEAKQHQNLGHYPTAYLTVRLLPHCQWIGGLWAVPSSDAQSRN